MHPGIMGQERRIELKRIAELYGNVVVVVTLCCCCCRRCSCRCRCCRRSGIFFHLEQQMISGQDRRRFPCDLEPR